MATQIKSNAYIERISDGMPEIFFNVERSGNYSRELVIEVCKQLRLIVAINELHTNELVMLIKKRFRWTNAVVLADEVPINERKRVYIKHPCPVYSGRTVLLPIVNGLKDGLSETWLDGKLRGPIKYSEDGKLCGLVEYSEDKKNGWTYSYEGTSRETLYKIFIMNNMFIYKTQNFLHFMGKQYALDEYSKCISPIRCDISTGSGLIADLAEIVLRYLLPSEKDLEKIENIYE